MKTTQTSTTVNTTAKSAAKAKKSPTVAKKVETKVQSVEPTTKKTAAKAKGKPVEKVIAAKEVSTKSISKKIATGLAAAVIASSSGMASAKAEKDVAAVTVNKDSKQTKKDVASIKPMRKGTKMYLVAISLLTGATMPELMKSFSYTSGGAGSTVFCKQGGILSKGYEIQTEKVDG